MSSLERFLISSMVKFATVSLFPPPILNLINADLIIGRNTKRKLFVNQPWFPYAPPVEHVFRTMPRRPESIAVTPAILQAAIRAVRTVDNTRFENEKAYQLTMSLARTIRCFRVAEQPTETTEEPKLIPFLNPPDTGYPQGGSPLCGCLFVFGSCQRIVGVQTRL